MPGNKKNSIKLPPCPDPEQYILVKTKEGDFWRRKRQKQSPVNRSLSANVSATEIVSPAVKRIRNKLEEYTRKLDTGRLHGRLTGLLNKTYKTKGFIDYSALKGFEFQPDHPLARLLLTRFIVNTGSEFTELLIPVTSGVLKKQNDLVTDFYFEGIMLSGDPLADEPLQSAYALSKPYSFTNTLEEDCKIVLPLPEKNVPWMLMLKVSCLEGNEMAVHPKHYGMRVVEVGG